MSRTILVIRFSSLGDIILTSPTVLNLRLAHPADRIMFLTKEKFAPVVTMIPGVNEVITLPDKAGTFETIKLYHELDKRGISEVVDLQGNSRSWLARKYISSSCTVRYPKRRLGRQLALWRTTHEPPWPHTIDLYNNVMAQLDENPPIKRPVLVLPTSNASVEEFGLSDKYIVIAPGAAHPTKQWPLERFEELAGKLIEVHDTPIAWVYQDDQDRPALKGIDRDKVSLIQNAPLDRLAEICSQAQMTIANDSGVMHLSGAVGTPTLGIFGPTHPVLGFTPRGRNDRIVEVDEYCRPCSRHGKKPCFREERFCLTRISSDMVLSEASELIDSRQSLSPAIFVDRDGTLIKEKHFLSDPDKVEFEDGAIAAIGRAREAGYKIVIISNQSGLARGLLSFEQVEAVNRRVLEELEQVNVPADGLYYCPHYRSGSVPELSADCACRKPASGMAEQAAAELNLDLKRSVVIGDKLDDYYLGVGLGCQSIMVRSGHGQEHIERLGDLEADYVICENLSEAVDMIMSERK